MRNKKELYSGEWINDQQVGGGNLLPMFYQVQS